MLIDWGPALLQLCGTSVSRVWLKGIFGVWLGFSDWEFGLSRLPDDLEMSRGAHPEGVDLLLLRSCKSMFWL